MTFAPFEHVRYDAGPYDTENPTYAAYAYIEGCTVGHMIWDEKTGEILEIFTRSQNRRLGYATALFRIVSRDHAVTHSSERTASGQAWALSLGEPLPPWVPL